MQGYGVRLSGNFPLVPLSPLALLLFLALPTIPHYCPPSLLFTNNKIRNQGLQEPGLVTTISQDCTTYPKMLWKVSKNLRSCLCRISTIRLPAFWGQHWGRVFGNYLKAPSLRIRKPEPPEPPSSIHNLEVEAFELGYYPLSATVGLQV